MSLQGVQTPAVNLAVAFGNVPVAKGPSQVWRGISNMHGHLIYRMHMCFWLALFIGHVEGCKFGLTGWGGSDSGRCSAVTDK